MKKIISFCITCKNRFSQIKKTLPINLRDNYNLRSIVEFVIVDFGSTDGLQEMIVTKYLKYIKQGYLKYYHTLEMPLWHASIAKNTAHLYADGEILVNLDCDNYSGKNGASFLINTYNRFKSPIVLHQFSGSYHDGTFGRISMRRKYFFNIGGYDESFAPMGAQDSDLILRLLNSGLKYVHIKNSNYNKALKNTKVDSLLNCNSNNSYEEMNQYNRSLSLRNFNEGKVIANNGKFGIRSNIFNCKGEKTQLIYNESGLINGV